MARSVGHEADQLPVRGVLLPQPVQGRAQHLDHREVVARRPTAEQVSLADVPALQHGSEKQARSSSTRIDCATCIIEIAVSTIRISSLPPSPTGEAQTRHKSVTDPSSPSSRQNPNPGHFGSG